MKKIFALAALALCLAACNKQDIQPVGQNDGMITLTATLAPKGAATKALTDDGDGKLNAEWAQNEQLAILYMVGGTKKYTPATVTSVDAVTGAATIEFTVEPGTTDGTPCTVVYPASLVGGNPDFDVSSNAAFIGNQPGTFSADLDVRVTTGTISPVTPEAGLVLDTPLVPKFAIVKFKLRDSDDDPIYTNTLAVTIGTEAFVATPTGALDRFYLALPAVSDGTLIFSVPGDEWTSSYRSSKANLTIEAGKYYRSTVQMTVQSDNADYVPMGDGLKWATRNVGASSPSDYGDYFAWGETEPKSGGYDWSSYGFTTDGGSTFTKYTGSDYDVLQAVDDAATQSMDWGSSWRMPTNEEWQALLKEEDFTWAWVKNFNGSSKNGRLVISRKSGVMGNCIFLPAAGYLFWVGIYNTGSYGSYWSSSLDAGSPGEAYELYFGPDKAVRLSDYRYFGLSVRPVQAME